VNRPSVCDLVSNELMFFKLAIKDYTTHFLMICFFRLQAHTNGGAYREEPSCAEVTLCSVCQSFLNSPLALFSWTFVSCDCSGYVCNIKTCWRKRICSRWKPETSRGNGKIVPSLTVIENLHICHFFKKIIFYKRHNSDLGSMKEMSIWAYFFDPFLITRKMLGHKAV
jgi:hypothetical protein